MTEVLEETIRQIDRQLERLSSLWGDYESQPWLGRKALGLWKDRTYEILHKFNPDDADYFQKHVYGKPYNEIEDGAERERKIFESEVQIYSVHLTHLRGNYEDHLDSLLTKGEPVALPDPTRGGKYGTCRDLTAGEVQKIVDLCRIFTEAGGKVPDFYESQGFNSTSQEPRSYTLETLRSWLKKPKFAPRDT